MGLVQGVLEEHGIPSVSVSMLEKVTRKVNTPRALLVEHPLGHSLGGAGDVARQAAVIMAALALASREAPVIEVMGQGGGLPG